jgi:predicted AAA+ superfamily ATPase
MNDESMNDVKISEFQGKSLGEIQVQMDEYEYDVGGNDYESKLQYYSQVNKPKMAILFNYFNVLSSRRINKESEGDIQMEGILDDDNVFIDYLPDFPPLTFNYTALFNINGNRVSFVMVAFKEGNEIYNVIRLTSVNVDRVKSESVYNVVWNNAVECSNLKGSYLTVSDENLSWKVRELKNLDFDDVFLPENLMEELLTYTKLFKTKNVLQRFMFSGVPGTGKTESTRAVSNILNRDGVTVIKTNICKIINEKFELAKLLAPSIIILDDIDLYLGDRNSTGVSPLLGSFLDILDGVDKLPDNVGVIASTNAPHLIDLAAQRPGRFNKVLFFDKLTKDNIVNIIKKSLTSMNKKYNNVSDKDIETLTDERLVTFFKESGVTGAFIFETMQEIKNKSEILDKPIDIPSIIEEISENNKVLEDKLASITIDSKLKGKAKRLGF